MFLSRKFTLGTRTHPTLLVRSTCSCKKSVRPLKRSTLLISHVIKVTGFSASERWETLAPTVKERVVSQVADHLMEIFALRFDCAGSLYLSALHESGFVVGPIVSTPFYRALDGVVRTRESDADAASHAELSRFRGPFSKSSDYLQSFLYAELHFLSHHRSVALSEFDGRDTENATNLLEQGERVLRKALELCLAYPGDLPVHGQDAAPIKPFSLLLDDFRLSNIMVCLMLVSVLLFQLSDIHHA